MIITRFWPVGSLFFALFVVFPTAASPFERAREVFLRGDYQNAAELLDGLVLENPEDYLAHYNLGVLELELADTLAAEVHLRRSAELAPDDPWVCYYIGMLELASRDTSASIAWWERAVKESHSLAMAGLGVLLAEKAPARALELTDAALTAEPVTVAARVAKAQVLAQCAGKEQAYEYINSTLNYFPDAEVISYAVSLAEGDRDRTSHYQNLYLQTYASTGDDEPDFRGALGLSRRGEYDLTWLKPGTRWVYRGTWGPFTLGDLTVEIASGQPESGLRAVDVIYRVNSNPSIPFITVDDVYRARLSADFRQTISYVMSVRETWWRYDRSVESDGAGQGIVIRTVDNSGHYWIMRRPAPRYFLDGISLMFYARTLVRSRSSARVVTLVDYDYHWTNINFTGIRETVFAAGREWEAWKITGQAEYVGVAGLTDGFEGWFTADDEALPLKARFKIFVGSIWLELSSPTAQN